MWVFEPYQIVLFAIVGDIILGAIFNLDLEVFNPIRNYNKWTKINWFGVIVATIILHVIFPIFAIGYWIYMLVTVGRK